MFLEFIGNVPLLKHIQVRQSIRIRLSFCFFQINCYLYFQDIYTVISYLLGEGGVWRDMVGTPVVGVI